MCVKIYIYIELDSDLRWQRPDNYMYEQAIIIILIYIEK
jgi:hypothetical protein